MRNIIALCALAYVFVLGSCKKDNNPSGSNSSFLVRSYTEDVRNSVIGNSVTTYTLTYDDNNHLVSLNSTPAPPALSFIYKFPSTGSYTLDLYEQGILDIHEVFFLNGNAFLDSTFQYNNTNDSTTEKYIYNNSQQLVQQKTYDYFSTGAQLSNTANYTYDNLGNVISSVDGQGQIITYTYYTDLVNTLNMGKTFLPQTVNLVKTATLSSGGSTETATHFYTFDSNNRLIRDSTSTPEVELIGIKSYTY